jgi:hypothetical protein
MNGLSRSQPPSTELCGNVAEYMGIIGENEMAARSNRSRRPESDDVNYPKDDIV